MKQPKHVFITGANSGIGFATSKLLADSGYTVIAGVYPELDTAAELINSTSGTIYPIALDVQESTSIENAFDEIAKIVGEHGLTATINCAGIALLMPCEVMSSEEIKAVINTNLIGTFLTSQASLPFLRKTRGTLINIASDGGYLAMPFGSAYCASKFGVEALSDSLRAEVKRQGVRVVVVEPGNIATPIWQSFRKMLAQKLTTLSAELTELYRDDIHNLSQIEPSGIAVESVACKLKTIIESKSSKARYIIGPDARLTKFISFLPAKVRDYLGLKVVESYIKK